jgi:hypothetical protein
LGCERERAHLENGGRRQPLGSAAARCQCLLSRHQHGERPDRWAGCTTPGSQLFRSTDGITWQLVRNLPGEAPPLVCGLWSIDEDRVFASGTNDPAFRTGFMKTENGGKSWTARNMEDGRYLFRDEKTGWVVGGRGTRPHSRRNDVIPVVLKTEAAAELGKTCWTA